MDVDMSKGTKVMRLRLISCMTVPRATAAAIKLELIVAD